MSLENQPSELAPHKSNDETANSSQEIPNPVIPFSVVGGPANASARIGDRNYIFYYSDNNEAITYLVGTGFNYQQYEEIPVKVGADPVRGSRGSPIAAAVIESGSPPAASVHLFYITTTSQLKEVILNPASKIFRVGTLDNRNIYVNAGSGISILNSAQVTEPGFTAFLFYSPANLPRTIHLAARARDSSWAVTRISPF